MADQVTVLNPPGITTVSVSLGSFHRHQRPHGHCVCLVVTRQRGAECSCLVQTNRVGEALPLLPAKGLRVHPADLSGWLCLMFEGWAVVSPLPISSTCTLYGQVQH